MSFKEKMLRSLNNLRSNSDSSTSTIPIRGFDSLNTSDKERVIKDCEQLSVASISSFIGEYKVKVNTLYDIFSHTCIRYNQVNAFIEETELNCHPTAYKPNLDVSKERRSLEIKKTVHSLIAAGEYEIILEEFREIVKELEIKYNAIDRAMGIIASQKVREDDSNGPTIYDQLLAEREQIKKLFDYVQMILEEVFKKIRKSSENYSMKDAINKLLKQMKEDRNQEYRTMFMDALATIARDPNFRVIYHNPFVSEVDTKILSQIDILEGRLNPELKHSIEYLSKTPVDEVLAKIDEYDKYGRSNCTNIKLESLKKSFVFGLILSRNVNEAWKYLVPELPNELLLELFKLLAKYMHEDEKEVYKHRDDYKKPLEEAQKAIKEIRSNPDKEGITSEAYGMMLHFGCEMYHYGEKCYNYITPQWREKIAKTYIMLHWLWSNYTYQTLGPDHLFYHPTLDYDKTRPTDKEVHKYITEFKNEMLQELEKRFDFELVDLKISSKASFNFQIIASILASGKIPELYVRPTKKHPINYTSGNNYRQFYVDDINEDITLSQLYAHLRAINGDDIKLDFRRQMPINLSPYEYSFSNADYEASGFTRLLTLIETRLLDKQYDERILIVSNLVDNPINMIRSNSKLEAVYINDDSKLQELINTPCSLKCIFVPECFKSSLECGEGCLLPSGTSVIVVRNDVTYSELSDMLNQKIASMENAKRNVYINE